MSIQLPDGSVVSNWSPGWEKNLPQWYIDGYETGLFNEDNNWGRDFFPQTEWRSPTKRPPVIAGGPGMVPGYGDRTMDGPARDADGRPTWTYGGKLPLGEENPYGGGWGRHFDREGKLIPRYDKEGNALPEVETPLEGPTMWDKGTPSIGMPKYPKDFQDLSGDLGDTPPKPFKDFSGGLNNPPRPEGFQRVATGIADWLTGNKFDFDQRGPGKKFLDLVTKGGMKNKETGNTVAQDLAEKPPVPPIDPEKVLPPTLRQRVYARDQIKRVPNELGQLYADKDDPGFIDPRIQGNGMMTLQYIPELDNPNWRPEDPYAGVGQFGSGTLPM